MRCPYCLSDIPNDAMYCPNCGSPVTNREQEPKREEQYSSYVDSDPSYYEGGDQKRCPVCGNYFRSDSDKCPICGAHVGSSYTTQDTQYSYDSNTREYTTIPAGYNQKSQLIAGILGILVGSLGVHNFYLGYTGKGIIQLVLCIFSCGTISSVWGLIEGIMILTGNINKDANGVPLAK